MATAIVKGPGVGLELLERLGEDGRLVGDHRPHAVRAHLLEMLGDVSAADACYRKAARSATNIQEQRYLYSRATRLTEARLT